LRSPSGKLPVANARVNDLQNVSKGSKVFSIAIRPRRRDSSAN
jgi:hypothetical protein